MVETKMIYDEEWEEWQVELYINDELQENATYHTSCQVDAQLTEQAMLNDALTKQLGAQHDKTYNRN